MTGRRQGGKVSAEVKGATAAQTWKMLDFFSIHKVMPRMESCSKLEGIDGHPGCIRYCVGKPIPIDGGHLFVSFAKEKLLGIDHRERVLSYEIMDNNLGLQGYAAEMRVVDDGGESCRIEWSFMAENFGRWGTSKEFQEYQMATLRAIVEKIELSVVAEEAG